MGNRLSAYRLSAEWAAELISGHEPLDYLEYRVEGSPLNPRVVDQPPPYNGITSSPEVFNHAYPRITFGQRAHRLIADMLTGEYHFWDHDEQPFSASETETEDPRDWAVYGRRICGWIAGVFPRRFSNPDDVAQIDEALAKVGNREMAENHQSVAQRFASETYAGSYGEEPPPVGLRLENPEEYARKTLANLRGFFERARANEEFVVHCWV